MISILSKPREQISISDIQELFHLEIPEGEQIEYKKGLSRKGNGDEDDWLSGGKLGERAKRSLIKQVIALANTRGGIVILGVDQTQDKPPVAADVTPVPRCASLSDALTSIIMGRVEPLIPSFESFPIKTDGEAGIVALRVGRSHQAPHRDTATLKSYVRRHDQCRELTMREIQDLTLNMSRGLERLNNRFEERGRLFQCEFDYLIDPNDAVGFRLTAIPIGDDVRFNSVYENRSILQNLCPEKQRVYARLEEAQSTELQTHFDRCHFLWRPSLRAARGDSDEYARYWPRNSSGYAARYNIYTEIHCDGLIEIGLVAHRMTTGDAGLYIYPELPAVLFANLIAQTHKTRTQAGNPMADFAAQVTIVAKGSLRPVNRIGVQYGEPLGEIRPGLIKFPHYSIGDTDDFLYTLNLFHRDFYNFLGQDFDIESFPLQVKGWPLSKIQDDA